MARISTRLESVWGLCSAVDLLWLIFSTIVSTFMILSQLGICTAFVCFTSDSLRDIMDWSTSKPALLALLLPYLLLEFFMKTLQVVSYVSMMVWLTLIRQAAGLKTTRQIFLQHVLKACPADPTAQVDSGRETLGNLLNLVGFVLVLYHIFDDPHGEYIDATTDALPVLMSMGTFLFNLSAVGVVLSLDKALANPKVLTERLGVLDIGIMIPTTIATIFGVLGYWSFGTMEENILRSLPFDADTAMAAIGLYLIAVAFAHPIQCYPGIQIVLEVIKNWDFAQPPSEEALKVVEVIARPCFVLASFLICYLVPFQGPFIAFVGNLCTTLLALVFPAMMEISLMYPGPYGKYKFYLYKNLFLIVFGLITWAYGVVLSGYLIYVRILVARSPNDVDT